MGTTPGPSPTVSDSVLEPLPPDWLRARPRRWWIGQLLIVLAALLIDWVLTSVLIERGTYFLGNGYLSLLAILALCYGPLLVRRRWPLLAFATALAPTLVITATGHGQPFVGMLLGLHAVASLRPPVVSQWALFAAIVPGLAQSYWTYTFIDGHPDPIDFAIPAIFFTSLTLIVWAVGRHEFGTRLAAQRLRQEVAISDAAATDRERRRIARELHDILSHSVSAMMMQAAGARAVARSIGEEGAGPARLRTVEEALSTIEETGSQSLRELHRLLGALRGAEEGTAGPDLQSHDRGSDDHHHLNLHDLVERSSRSGLTVELHHIGAHQGLDPSVDSAAYRVVQESLTNALKHGGRGTVVDVYETWSADGLHLQVRSRPGPGEGTPQRPTAPSSGTGLVGLRERVELAGGSFEAGWVHGEFVTTATLPLTSTSDLRNRQGEP